MRISPGIAGNVNSNKGFSVWGTMPDLELSLLLMSLGNKTLESMIDKVEFPTPLHNSMFVFQEMVWHYLFKITLPSFILL